MTYLVDSGTCAKRFENSRSTQERGELCTHPALPAIHKWRQRCFFSHISISRFDVASFLIHTRPAVW